MTTEDAAPEFDVALSFLARHGLSEAQALHDELSKTLSVFFFPRQQENLSGTMGVETMRAAFRTNSRLNVLLYAEGWGKTPWTGIESAAITDRALRDGWGTLFFIMLEKVAPPIWLPDGYVYFSWEDYGLKEAVGAIKARVQERGGHINKETLAQKAVRLQQARAYKEARDHFNQNGVPQVDQEFAEFMRLMEERIGSLPGNFRTKYDRGDNALLIFGFPRPLKIIWSRFYGNSLENAQLRVETWTGHPATTMGWTIDTSRVGSTSYKPDIAPDGQVGWNVQGDILGASALVDYILEQQIEQEIGGGR